MPQQASMPSHLSSGAATEIRAERLGKQKLWKALAKCQPHVGIWASSCNPVPAQCVQNFPQRCWRCQARNLLVQHSCREATPEHRSRAREEALCPRSHSCQPRPAKVLQSCLLFASETLLSLRASWSRGQISSLLPETPPTCLPQNRDIHLLVPLLL